MRDNLCIEIHINSKTSLENFKKGFEKLIDSDHLYSDNLYDEAVDDEQLTDYDILANEHKKTYDILANEHKKTQDLLSKTIEKYKDLRAALYFISSMVDDVDRGDLSVERFRDRLVSALVVNKIRLP